MIFSQSDLEELSQDLVKKWSDYTVWCFYGEMGVGKTTLIKSICEVLEVVDPLSSPSFAIINEYRTNWNKSIFHFDFFRLRSKEEIHNLGIEEYLDSGDLCLIEWPDIIDFLLPDQYLEINIKLVGENQRQISVIPHGGAHEISI